MILSYRKHFVELYLGLSKEEIDRLEVETIVEEHKRTPSPAPREMRRALPCAYLGPEKDQNVCGSCTNNTRVKVFSCSNPGKPDGRTTLRFCWDHCPIYTPEYGSWNDLPEPVQMPSENMSLVSALKLLDSPPIVPQGSQAEWSSWKVVSDAHIIGADAAAARALRLSCPSLPQEKGIVMGVGGTDLYTQAWVCTKRLRDLGCKLPIQWWYIGLGEMDPTMIDLVQSELNVECVNARDHTALHPARILAGWELKPYSIIHSPFYQVLYLDADNTPCRDPTYLFDAMLFQELGAVFWPDIPPPNRMEWIPPKAWESCGMAYISSRAFETGQLMVDKRKCWPALQLTMWINEHSDRFYRVVYGDKDTFLLAWTKTNTRYAMPGRGADDNGAGLTHFDLQDNRIFQHRCQHKWRYQGPNRSPRTFYFGAECLQIIDGLCQRWCGRPWDPQYMSPDEDRLADEVVGLYQYERIGLNIRPLQLMQNGKIGTGRAGCEDYWSLYILNGVPTLIIGGGGRATMFLTGGLNRGIWRGRWEYYERCPVALVKLEGC
jgi:hypothetical protein